MDSAVAVALTLIAASLVRSFSYREAHRIRSDSHGLSRVLTLRW
jgi:hypothetical protein